MGFKAEATKTVANTAVKVTKDLANGTGFLQELKNTTNTINNIVLQNDLHVLLNGKILYNKLN